MPEITLDMLSLDSAPLLVERCCRFDGLGGTIGRDEGNTLVLQDKHRRVSRLHASVTFADGCAIITNASTSLPINVGVKLLDCGQKAPLLAGDLIEIGPYVLKVRAGVCLVPDDLVASNGSSPPFVAASTSCVPDLNIDLAFAPQGVSLPSAPVVALDPMTRTPAVPVTVSNDPFADIFAGIGPDAVGQSAAFGVSLGDLPSAAPSLSPVASVDPFAALLAMGAEPVAPVSNASYFGDSFGPSTSRASYSASSPLSEYTHSWSDSAPKSIIPDDFNPFELPSETTRNSADPLAQLFGGESSQSRLPIASVEPSIDALFASSEGSSFVGDSPTQSLGSYAPQGLDIFAPPADNSDPLMMFGVTSSGAADMQRQPMRNDLPEVGGAYQPPRAVAAGSVAGFSNTGMSAQSVWNVPPDVSVAASPDALTDAFLKGAGLTHNALPNGLTPEVMTIVGGLLRAATSGSLDMLAARAATKLELQANVTIISSQANNPLKFSTNVEVALQQMLGKKMPGFMRGDEAMKDAFNDLRAHEIGVIAGTRAALTEVLGRFDPVLLGEHLTGGSLIESLLPSMRKTKLWEIYLERYAQIRREAEDDFQSIFGRSFLQAYERETARVKAQTT